MAAVIASMLVVIVVCPSVDFAATDAVTALDADELANLVNAIIFGAYCDWYQQVTAP